MPRIEPIDASNPPEEVVPLLEQAKQVTGGKIVNLHRELGVSPMALQAYVGLNDALAEGALPPELQEEIAIAVADANGCNY